MEHEYTALEKLYGLNLYRKTITIDDIPEDHREAAIAYCASLQN